MSSKSFVDYDYEYHKIKSQIAILKDVEKDYPTTSLPNAIQQLESRLKEIEKNLI